MEIKVVFLCAGYGTRLEKDIQKNLKDESCAKSLGVAKALVPIGDKPLIAHWIALLSEIEGINHFYIVTNNRYYDQFAQFSKHYSDRVSIVNDGTNNNTDRMGAVSSIQYAVTHFNLESQDVLVIGGDTLLYSDFNPQSFLSSFRKLKSVDPLCGLVTTYECKDSETTKYGILEVDDTSGKVLSLIEKPEPHETSSRLACPCFYLFSSASASLIKSFLKGKKDAPLIEKDATGHFIKYLICHSSIHQHRISGRFDVGGLESYKACHAYFSNQRC